MARDMQRLITGSDVTQLTGNERKEYVREQALGLTDELHEALSEVDWKSWATSAELNRAAYLRELVDVLFMLSNLMLVADPRPGEVSELYLEKYHRNVERYTRGPNGENKYHGRIGKCPTCHRDFTDLRMIQGGLNFTTYTVNDKTFCSEACANNYSWGPGVAVDSGQFPG